MIKGLPASVLAHLIEESLDAVLIMDAECCIRYINAAMVNLCGYQADELLGESLNKLLPVEVAVEHDTYVQGYLKGLRTAKVLGQVRELEIVHCSGMIIPIELKAVDLGEDGDSHFFGASFGDLRARKAIDDKRAILVQALEQQALTDVLTELPNRRAFESEARHVMANAEREGWPVVIGIADIDFFKQVNDQYGHLAGDKVLQQVSKIIQSIVRAGDLCGRIGGEEFALLLPRATIEQATEIVERIRETIAAQAIAVTDTDETTVTISIGLAQLNPSDELKYALGQADAALYRAKRGGRNQVTSSGAGTADHGR